MAIGGGGLLVIIVLALLFGVDPQQLLNAPGVGGAVQPGAPADNEPADPEEERLAAFTKVIFHDTEVVWDELFAGMGKRYQKPTLVLFSGRVESACGLASAAVGPFYCGGDGNVYIDLAFYRDMERKLEAPGEFARAYVLAHEVGHHVQRLVGLCRHGRPGTRVWRPAANKSKARCGSNCRPITWPASGPIMPSRSSTSSTRATWRVRAQRGLPDRRRPAAKGVARLCRARRLHARHVGTA